MARFCSELSTLGNKNEPGTDQRFVVQRTDFRYVRITGFPFLKNLFSVHSQMQKSGKKSELLNFVTLNPS